MMHLLRQTVYKLHTKPAEEFQARPHVNPNRKTVRKRDFAS
ncbi:MAG: hypothetical protein ACO1OK_04910 [Devosia sp.]